MTVALLNAVLALDAATVSLAAAVRDPEGATKPVAAVAHNPSSVQSPEEPLEGMLAFRMRVGRCRIPPGVSASLHHLAVQRCPLVIGRTSINFLEKIRKYYSLVNDLGSARVLKEQGNTM